MQLLKIFQRRPVVLGLAIVTAVAMVFVSEVTYWKSVRSLQALEAQGVAQRGAVDALSDQTLALAYAQSAANQKDLYQALMRNRVCIALLSAMGLLPLILYVRQSLALAQQQQSVQYLVQTERDRLEREVSQRTAQLTELTNYLQAAREDERHRLARNLHDDLGALLTSAKLDAARIRSRLASAGPVPETLDLLAHLVTTLNTGIELGRSIIEDLRPSALSNLGLVATLEILVGEFAAQSGVQIHSSLEPVALEQDEELMVYRLVQEALTNITKHAHATHVWVALGMNEGQVEASVRDDGVGFNSALKPTSAYGLVGMRFRVEAEGGELTVVSAPGQGTQIQMRLPAAYR